MFNRIKPAGTTAFSQGVVVGDMIFVSGQVAGPPDQLSDLAVEEQTRRAFANLSAVLAEAGMDLADVVKLTTLLKNKSDFGGYLAVKNSIGLDAPASTTVFVTDFVPDGALIEIEAIAIRSPARSV